MRTKQLETLISGFLGVRTGWPPATDLREWEGKRILQLTRERAGEPVLFWCVGLHMPGIERGVLRFDSGSKASVDSQVLWAIHIIYIIDTKAQVYVIYYIKVYTMVQ